MLPGWNERKVSVQWSWISQSLTHFLDLVHALNSVHSHLSFPLFISHLVLPLPLSLSLTLSLTHTLTLSLTQSAGQICSFIYNLADLGWNVDECLKISVVKWVQFVCVCVCVCVCVDDWSVAGVLQSPPSTSSPHQTQTHSHTHSHTHLWHTEIMMNCPLCRPRLFLRFYSVSSCAWMSSCVYVCVCACVCVCVHWWVCLYLSVGVSQHVCEIEKKRREREREREGESERENKQALWISGLMYSSRSARGGLQSPWKWQNLINTQGYDL